MIRGVLDLVERPLRSIMSPRNEVEWLDLDETNEELLAEIRTLSHSRVVLARGRVDEFVGVALTNLLGFEHKSRGGSCPQQGCVFEPDRGFNGYDPSGCQHPDVAYAGDSAQRRQIARAIHATCDYSIASNLDVVLWGGVYPTR